MSKSKLNHKQNQIKFKSNSDELKSKLKIEKNNKLKSIKSNKSKSNQINFQSNQLE